jgi:hypothetical protein
VENVAMVRAVLDDILAMLIRRLGSLRRYVPKVLAAVRFTLIALAAEVTTLLTSGKEDCC